MRFASFSFHGKCRIMRTAWNTVLIQGVAILFHGKFDTQRNEDFFKPDVSKKGFIDLDGIKRCISKEGFGIDQRMLLEEVD